MNLIAIYTKAYEITKNHKSLWFFGFLLTGFVGTLEFRSDSYDHLLQSILTFAYTKPYIFLSVAFLSLLGVIVLFIVSIAAKIKLILKVEKIDDPKLEKVVTVKQFFVPVVGISLISTICLSVVLGLFFLPWWWQTRGFLDSSLSIVFVVLAGCISFIFTCINIFATLFAVFYKVSLAKSLDLAIDLFHTKWFELFMVGCTLFIIQLLWYALGFILASVISGVLLKVIEHSLILLFLPGLPWLLDSFVKVIILWTFAAVFAVYFNAFFVLFFKETVKHIEDPEFKTSPALSGVE